MVDVENFFRCKFFRHRRRLRHIFCTKNNIFSFLFDLIFSSTRKTKHLQHTNIMLKSVRRKLRSQCNVSIRQESNIKITLTIGEWEGTLLPMSLHTPPPPPIIQSLSLLRELPVYVSPVTRNNFDLLSIGTILVLHV